jgi:hypothetical protein
LRSLSNCKAYCPKLRRDNKNSFTMSLSEVRNQVNITIDFMLKLPASEKSVYYNTNVQVYEDLSAFRTRLKVYECKMVTD